MSIIKLLDKAENILLLKLEMVIILSNKDKLIKNYIN